MASNWQCGQGDQQPAYQGGPDHRWKVCPWFPRMDHRAVELFETEDPFHISQTPPYPGHDPAKDAQHPEMPIEPPDYWLTNQVTTNKKDILELQKTMVSIQKQLDCLAAHMGVSLTDEIAAPTETPSGDIATDLPPSSVEPAEDLDASGLLDPDNDDTEAEETTSFCPWRGEVPETPKARGLIDALQVHGCSTVLFLALVFSTNLRTFRIVRDRSK